MARTLILTLLLVACKQVDPPTEPPTRLEPTPFDDILPGFEDPGTYAVPTHSIWTLDDPLRSASSIEVHDFDRDGRVELVVGARAWAGNNGDFPGPNSGVFWPEEVLGGGRLEDARQITWDNTDRNYGRIARIDDALIVEGGPNDDGTYLSVFADGWAPTFAEATFTLATGVTRPPWALGLVVCDLDADGVQDLAGMYGAVRGPLAPESSASWTWTLNQRRLTIQDGSGWMALEDGVRLLVAFVPKPVPLGEISDFEPWAWSGPEGITILDLGNSLVSQGGWLVLGRVEAGARTSHFFVHPEFNSPLGEVTSMHDGVRMSTHAAEGDLDGDGLDDVVLTSGQAATGEFVFVSIFRTPLPAVASEQDAWVRIHMPPGTDHIADLRIVDVDGDDRNDLIILYWLHDGDAKRVVVITADDLLDRVPPTP